MFATWCVLDTLPCLSFVVDLPRTLWKFLLVVSDWGPPSCSPQKPISENYSHPQFSTVLYYIILYRILYYIVLYYIILHYVMWLYIMVQYVMKSSWTAYGFISRLPCDMGCSRLVESPSSVSQRLHGDCPMTCQHRTDSLPLSSMGVFSSQFTQTYLYLEDDVNQ